MPRGDWGDAFANAYTGSMNLMSEMILKKQEMGLKQKELDKKNTYEEAIANYLKGGSVGGGANGLGVTGLTMGKDGMSLNIGETAAMKDTRENTQKAEEAIRKEDAEYGNSMALLKGLKDDWLKTNPTRLTNNGKFSPVGAVKGVLQPAYMVEQWLGKNIGATRNQRADAVYVRRVNALQSRLAKGVIGKDTGNLNYQEQIAAKGGVAGLGDPYEVGVELFNKTEGMLKEMLSARKQGYKNITEKWKDEGRVLTKEKALEYLQKANGDKSKAELLATQDRWAF